MGARFMMFKATFNKISVISWRLVLVVEETGVPGESHRPVASHWQLYHIMLYRLCSMVYHLSITIYIREGNMSLRPG